MTAPSAIGWQLLAARSYRWARESHARGYVHVPIFHQRCAAGFARKARGEA